MPARIAAAVLALMALTGATHAEALRSRPVLARTALPAPPAHPHRLVVKFRDEVRARNTGGEVCSLAGCDVDAIATLRRRFRAMFRPLIGLPQRELNRLERRAARRSGVRQPDLAGFMIVDCPPEHESRVARALHHSPLTEIVYYEQVAPPPPCLDAAPVTPIYHAQQTYFDGPAGLNISEIRRLGNAGGAGIQVADCEYGFNDAHEDLCGVTMEPDQTINPGVFSNDWDEHGTAILGELASLDNGFGCRGLVPDADISFFTEWSVEEGFRRTTAIANAIASVDAGDVVMLLMQMAGPGGGFGPAELDPAVWLLARNATDAGIVVVAAAGNGSQDLDSAAYQEYRDRGDSGAIIVGAGSASTIHSRLSFSTYGSRVNLQGWGTAVFTLGYGTYAELGGDENQRYTAGFNGTSSATPMVAAACVALQGLAEEHLGQRLSPAALRDVLVRTGIPQGGTANGPIGPFPDVLAAAAELGIADVTPPSGDANADGVIDVLDLIAVVLAWGPCPPAPAACQADFDGNGQVDVNDLTTVILNWGA